MNFRNFLFVITCIFVCNSILSQIKIGPSIIRKKSNKIYKYPQMVDDSVLCEKYLNVLKASPTYFVYRDSDSTHLDNLRKELTEAWNYSTLKFISSKQFNDMKIDSTLSFITMEVFTTSYATTDYDFGNKTSSEKTDYIQWEYLNLWVQFKDYKVQYFSFPLIFEKKQDEFNKFKILKLRHDSYENEKIDESLYRSNISNILNWQIGILKNNLKLANELFNKSYYHSFYKKFTTEFNTEEIKKVSSETLFIPEFSFENMEKEVLEKNYPYPYQIIKNDELSNLILANKAIYYLIIINNKDLKGSYIVNSKTSELIYYSSNLNRISQTNIKDIIQKIKK